jgi:nucleoside-diphosphate-sugar epimerase
MIAMTKRFVFLGSSGRIGQLVKAVWPAPESSGLSVDWQFRTHRDLPKDAFHWSDLSDPSALIEHIALVGAVDGAFVFVGVTPNGSSPAGTAMTDNIDLALSTIESCAKAGLKQLIVASSSAVYGAGTGDAFSEVSLTQPVNAYGAAKLEMENVCREAAARVGVEVCFLRIGNVAGADSLLGRFAAHAQPLTLDIFPDGDGPRRSYIGAVGLSHVLTKLALTSEALPDVLNVGASASVSMNALLDAADVEWSKREVASSPLQNIVLDCHLLERLCGAEFAASDPRELIAEWRLAMGAV